MLWAPRVTFIKLHREQSEGGGGCVGFQRGDSIESEEQATAWQDGLNLMGK
jgi:hypothetical protein